MMASIRMSGSSCKLIDMSRLRQVSFIAALLSIPALCVFGQVQFDRAELDSWLQQERPEWTESQRTAFVDVLERRREVVLSTFPAESAEHILTYAPEFALQRLSPQLESMVHFEIVEEELVLLSEAYAARTPFNEDEQKRVDEQVGLIEKAVRTALNEVAVGLPTQEALDEFNLITEERLQQLRFAAACPLDPNFKSVLSDEELEAVLAKIAARGESAAEALQNELVEIEQERLDGVPSELLTVNVSMLIDPVLTATETMTEVPDSERLRELHTKLTKEFDTRSSMRHIARHMDLVRRAGATEAKDDPEATFLEAARTLQARAVEEVANPEEPSGLPVEPDPVEQEAAASTPEQSGFPIAKYVGLGAVAALLAFIGIYLFGRHRGSHGQSIRG